LDFSDSGNQGSPFVGEPILLQPTIGFVGNCSLDEFGFQSGKKVSVTKVGLTLQPKNGLNRHSGWIDSRKQMGHICVMAKTAILRTRVDSDKAAAAQRVFSKPGISMGDAVNLFLGQVSIHKGIPFALTTRPHLDLSNAPLEEIEDRYAGFGDCEWSFDPNKP
jgi:addiction module RelB/DinJ family antitoxin